MKISESDLIECEYRVKGSISPDLTRTYHCLSKDRFILKEGLPKGTVIGVLYTIDEFEKKNKVKKEECFFCEFNPNMGLKRIE